MANGERRPVDARYILSRIRPLKNGAEQAYGIVFPTLCRAIEIIQRAPTVTEEPLVRCKDCRYWIFSGNKEAQCVTTEEWYCADGERNHSKGTTRKSCKRAKGAVED